MPLGGPKPPKGIVIWKKVCTFAGHLAALCPFASNLWP